jgi:ATP-dependent Lhr-like helicase
MNNWQDLFHPLTAEWFSARFGSPTEPQLAAWPSIAAGHNTLVAAPTGSGKTLAAFMVCLDRLIRHSIAGRLPNGIDVLYLSPLKALSNDIERNLQTPLEELRELAVSRCLGDLPIRAAVRTGDTPQRERQAMLRNPPHILVTTPESLYLLLTSTKGRERLRTVRTVIVDEIHALARDKRGSHLALSLERLNMLCDAPPVRIGLSATQKPMEEIAQFLVGAEHGETGNGKGETEINRDDHTLKDSPSTPLLKSEILNLKSSSGSRFPVPGSPCPCIIVNAGHARDLDLAIEVPPSELAAVCSNEQWGEVYERLAELITSHRSTLVFVNTRRLAERVAHHLTDMLGEEAVASHHGSLSRQIRHDAEQRLKAGKLRAIVATASLEMGIDIGYIDLVTQVGSPRSIATFLQRVGRSGHSLGKVPKGRLFPLTRDELLECMALVRAVRSGALDRIEIPEAPLDILAQQIVAAAAAEELDETELYNHFCRAYPYRNLARKDFDAILTMLTDGIKPGVKHGTYLHRDRIHGKLRARKGARLAAITNGGAIPETGEYRVVTEGEGTYVGSLDEDFAIESSAGDVFLLGGTSWRVVAVRGGEVRVADAQGAPPTVPFWFGESPGRTIELSHEISQLRRDLAELALQHREWNWEGVSGRGGERGRANTSSPPLPCSPSPPPSSAIAQIVAQCHVTDWAAGQALQYVAAQQAALGVVPTGDDIVFERFFDESGGMQLVIHAPLGARINRAWGLAMRKRFCRSFDFELQAAADDDGVLLSLSPQHSFPIEQLFSMLNPQNAQHLLEQALLAAPMFQIRWRWNITRSLAVLRRKGNKRVAPHLQKFRAEDLLAAAFPETVGCLENHHGDVEIPDHPLVKQTMHDCLHEAMDLPRWLNILQNAKESRIRLIARDTREPSPFCHELLNANPYAFLDGAPLEERRTRAIQTRRSLNIDDFRDLARLDPLAIAQVTEEAWPTARDAEELHDALMGLVVVHEYELRHWATMLAALVKSGRAAKAHLPDGTVFCFAAERLPIVRSVYPDAKIAPKIQLPADLDAEVESHVARVAVVRGRISHCGPQTPEELAALLSLEPSQVAAALEALEGEGLVLRGQYTEAAWALGEAGRNSEWFERRLLARVHRLTLAGLRKRIAPVEPDDYLYYLTRHHGVAAEHGRDGPAAVRLAIQQLQGFELAAGAWERSVLAARVKNYDARWLDELFLSGELIWGRLRPPKRNDDAGPSMAALTRTAPISLVFRDDIDWLLPPDRCDASGMVRESTGDMLALLQQRGALFMQELRSRCGLLPSQAEDALRELAALGLVTSDTFAAIRAMASEKKLVSRRRDALGKRLRNLQAGAGRWSLFPGHVDVVERATYLEKWCRLLLTRYGVAFRDLLTRENAAPSWSDLVPMFRKLELRGEVRGGRFVSHVAGEQYALEETITQLREARDARQSDLAREDWAILSAVDPLNLMGIVNSQAKITSNPKTALVLNRGRCVAVKQSGQIEFLEPIPGELQFAMRRALQLGRRVDRDLGPAQGAPNSA